MRLRQVVFKPGLNSLRHVGIAPRRKENNVRWLISEAASSRISGWKRPHFRDKLDLGLEREKQMIFQFLGVFAALEIFADDGYFHLGEQSS